jgi:hypothetical protein
MFGRIWNYLFADAPHEHAWVERTEGETDKGASIGGGARYYRFRTITISECAICGHQRSRTAGAWGIWQLDAPYCGY